jgi:hypothetical protein
MFSPVRLPPREKRRPSPSDRLDNRADHTCRADTPSLQQDHQKSSWRKEFAEVFAAGRPSGCASLAEQNTLAVDPMQSPRRSTSAT